MAYRSKPCKDEVLEDVMKFEIPRFVCVGILCLFLLRQTVNDYRAGGLYDLWTVASAFGFVVSITYFVSFFRSFLTLNPTVEDAP